MKRWIGAVVGSALLSTCLGVGLAQSQDDKEFLQKSSQGNLAEIQTAKLALQKSQNADVRSFAQRMIKDHQMLSKKMSPFLAKAGVPPATSLNSEHQELYDKLKGLSGAEFDKEYVSAMDKDHHEDLQAFQKEESSTQVGSLKTTVASGEKVIAEHTQMIDNLSKKMGMEPAGS